MLFLSYLVTLLLTETSHGLPPNISLATPLLRRESADPGDLSWIKTLASVGDSYSVGIGAGTRLGGLGDYFCSRYDESFPALINSDPRLGSSDGRVFTYWPCSGANTDKVISQVNALPDGSQDLITITSGGNDAFLTPILNECVYQWNSGATPWSSKCSDQLHSSFDVISSSDFHSKLDKLISAAKSKLKPGGHIYYVGYAQFWGQETNQCDGVTWAFWYALGKREYLTQDKRTQMNTLVRNMNQALSEAVDRGGPSVTFIDYDQYYVLTEGRFCEDGYVETSPNRNGLLFYEWNTDDNAPVTTGLTAQYVFPPPVVTPGLVMNGTFEGQINEYIQQTLAQHPEWRNNLTMAQGAPPSINSINATKDQIVVGYSDNFVPDGIGRVFHPRPNGHQLIANLILYHVGAANAEKLHQYWPPEEITTGVCPAPTVASLSSAPTQSAATQNSTSSPTSSPTPTPKPTPTPTATPNPSVTSALASIFSDVASAVSVAQHDPIDMCGTWYRFVLDYFEIYGRNFNSSTFGTDGSGLHHQLSGCGALTKWSFTNLTNDPHGYQWKATGDLPVGAKACVGRAVVSAGGSSADGCTGPG